MGYQVTTDTGDEYVFPEADDWTVSDNGTLLITQPKDKEPRQDAFDLPRTPYHPRQLREPDKKVIAAFAPGTWAYVFDQDALPKE